MYRYHISLVEDAYAFALAQTTFSEIDIIAASNEDYSFCSRHAECLQDPEKGLNTLAAMFDLYNASRRLHGAAPLQSSGFFVKDSPRDLQVYNFDPDIDCQSWEEPYFGAISSKDPALIQDRALVIARSNLDLRDILRWFADGIEWVDLYRAFEVLKNEEKYNVPKILGSKSEQTRFTAPANNPSSSGRSSRHGRSANNSPSKEWMQLEEATAYICNAVARAFNI